MTSDTPLFNADPPLSPGTDSDNPGIANAARARWARPGDNRGDL